MKKNAGIGLLSGKIHIVDSYFLPFTFSLLLAVSFLSAQVGWGPDVRLTYMQGGGWYPRAACCGDTIHLVWWHAYTGHDEIFYLRSTDAGESWSDPVRLSVEDEQSGTMPQIAVSGNTVHVIWFEEDYGVVYRRSSDGGDTWQGIDSIIPGMHYSSIFADSSLIYIAGINSATGILMFTKSYDGGNTWQPVMNVTLARASPTLRCISDDILALSVTYRALPGACEIYDIRSFNGGETWTDSQMVSEDDGISSFDPAMTTDDSGGIHIDWCDYKYSPYPWTGDIFYRASRDSGNTWEPIDSLTVQHRAVASDILAEGNNLHLVWEDDRNGFDNNFEIYYRMSSDLGRTWGPEIRLTNAPYHSYCPSLACGGRYLHLFWQDRRDYGNSGSSAPLYYKRKGLSGGVSELEGNLSSGIDFGIFPNPFSKLINISFGRGHSAESRKQKGKDSGDAGLCIRIYDISGKEVLAYETEGRRVEISTRSLSCGVYFVEVWAGGNRGIRKVVKIE
ncbi:MAG TPA: T9SS type A sorting domain-containing protein [candidate division WOR-3 bacterium]|uniref:T9SS type A sorting domain-containing protein n=1 Tax=candidate division WOR-3 bacterium TaxID=2052148 RepID=A0A9C9ELN0_UNCW3|nr:T9SS type A sorting domain-containing protein [candidate division WOR-3 bacterium]